MQKTTTEREEVESLYDYLCDYLGIWKEPPEVKEVMQDLSMTGDELHHLLAQLEAEQRVTPGTTIARGCYATSR